MTAKATLKLIYFIDCSEHTTYLFEQNQLVKGKRIGFEMYAHQVIESLQHTIKHHSPDDLYQEGMASLVPLLIKSQKFHMGTFENLQKVFEKQNQNNVFLDFAKFVRMPYPTCWFDYQITVPNLAPGQRSVPKRGLLISQKSKSPFFIAWLFYFVDELKIWILEPQMYIVSTGKHFKDTDFGRSGDNDGNIWSIPIVSPSNKHRFNFGKLREEASPDLYALAYFLLLLSCKNIQTKKENAPLALNKKRKRKNKVPLFDYYTLFLKLPNNSTKKCFTAKNESHNRIHLCRGHFKEYTSENPLFGKYTGLYWWQPHVRGDKKQGIVMKNYEAKMQ